jgi:hypothetical protein
MDALCVLSRAGFTRHARSAIGGELLYETLAELLTSGGLKAEAC